MFDSSKLCDVDDLDYIIKLAHGIKLSFCHLQKRDFGVLQCILNQCRLLNKQVELEFVHLKYIDTDVFTEKKMKTLMSHSINQISFSYPQFLRSMQDSQVDHDFDVPKFNLYEKEQLHMKGIDFMEFLSQESEIKEIRMEMLGFQNPIEYLNKLATAQNGAG